MAPLILFILAGCAQKTLIPPDNNIASDSMAQGNVSALAVRKVEGQDVCFEIALTMKEVEQRYISPSNWTVAWIDSSSRYHLLTLNQRIPASVPQTGGKANEWKNDLRTCAPKAKIGDIKLIILTPKELPFKETEGLKFEWN